jgi:hypothetical protein
MLQDFLTIHFKDKGAIMVVKKDMQISAEN